MRSIVGLEKCRSYEKRVLLDAVESLASVSGLEASRDTRVLIKPNLVSAGGGRFHLACTSPQWIAAVAEWFVEQGAKVRIGDSPAFGTAKMVLGRIGADSLLTGSGARVVNFSRSSRCRLPCGVNVPVAVEALECDLLLNLPRVDLPRSTHPRVVEWPHGVSQGHRSARGDDAVAAVVTNIVLGRAL